MVSRSFINNMPKVELHAHLNGSLSTEALLELGMITHGKTTDQFRKLCESFKDLSKTNLEDCFKKFQIAHDLTTTVDGLRKATLCAIRDFANDNLIYLELRTTPKSTAHMEKHEYLESVIAGISASKDLYPDICVKLIPSIDRSKGVETARDILNLVLKARATYPDIIRGIDFSGNPACGSFDDYCDILSEARDNGLKLALHCAEVENAEEIDKMLEFGMDRCGHGTFLSSGNIALAREKGIVIECCLSSNVKCGTVASYEDHHFQSLFGSHYPVVLCTDDCGVFDTTLSNEYYIANKTFGLSKEGMKTILLTSVNAAFACELEKEHLRSKIEEYFAKS